MTKPLTPAPVCYRTQTRSGVTRQLVTTVAVNSGEDQAAVYERIYTRLLFLYGVDVYTLPNKAGDSLLTVAERHDLLDKVYAIAFAEHLYQQQYEE